VIRGERAESQLFFVEIRFGSIIRRSKIESAFTDAESVLLSRLARREARETLRNVRRKFHVNLTKHSPDKLNER